MSLLQQIQVTTQQIAEAIAGVLDIEVTIVDDELVRIAGTGYHYQTIGTRIEGKSMYQSVLTSKKEYVMSDVHTDGECSTCERKAICRELAELCCPILIGAKVIGVIGLIAFSPERQQELRHKNQRLLTFIRQMAELIAAKAVEVDSLNRAVLLKNQLETVVNFISEGILAIDHTAKIISMNYSAEKMLGVKAKDFIGFYINEVFPGTPIPDVLRDGNEFSNREVSIWQRGRHHHYRVNAKPMLIDGVIHGVVASFWSVGSKADQAAGASMVGPKGTFDDIIGTSRVFQEIKNEAQKAAVTNSTVLIVGGSGTGKEMFAQAIHNASGRAERPFVAINCAAIPENLLESELFGYQEGSFTGARKGGKPGKFQLADGGTLFLDEVGDMPLLLQSKILRVLQEKTVEPVGGLRSYSIDVRVIAATNQPLEQLVKAGKFREDLYYRLNVFPLLLPPLNERPGDILELIQYFLVQYSRENGGAFKKLSPQARDALLRYSWPGNVRELENALECGMIRSSGEEIQENDLPQRLLASGDSLKRTCQEEDYAQQGAEIIKTVTERERIKAELARYGTTVAGKQQAAKSLGIGIATLYRKLRKYEIS